MRKRFPRPRGDRPLANASKAQGQLVSPAHAGIDPYLPSVSLDAIRFPRPRGDRPAAWICNMPPSTFPPPTRG